MTRISNFLIDEVCTRITGVVVIAATLIGVLIYLGLILELAGQDIELLGRQFWLVAAVGLALPCGWFVAYGAYVGLYCGAQLVLFGHRANFD